MHARKVMIKNPTGLHARPASEFVQCAEAFESKIEIRRAGEAESVNAKSMVLLLTLGLCQGEEAEITASGVDEVKAADSLASLVESGFGEI